MNGFNPPDRRGASFHPSGSLFLFIPALFAFLPGCTSWSNSSDPVEFSSNEWEYKGAKGTILKSNHYEIYTTCKSKGFVNALPGFMETCYSAYEELLPVDNTPDEPMKAYLFQTRWQWDRFTEDFTGPRAATYKRIRSGGYSEQGITVSHYDTSRSALSVLAHEGLHQYLEMTHGKNIPPWINEGLACYFESFDLDRNNRPTFKPEKNTLRSPSLREALIAKSLIPLKEVLATHAGLEVAHTQANRVRNYYAQEWSLVVFLMRDSVTSPNPYKEGFQALLRELGSDTMDRKARAQMATDQGDTITYGEAVFRAYITEDYETFQAEYEAYLRDLLNMKA